jgi:nicotinamidase-related amidase
LLPLQAVFPEQEPIDRTNLNAFEDPRIVEWVRNSGRKKLVMAGLWTESCLVSPFDRHCTQWRADAK